MFTKHKCIIACNNRVCSSDFSYDNYKSEGLKVSPSSSTSRTRVEEGNQWSDLRKLTNFDIWATNLSNTKEYKRKE